MAPKKASKNAPKTNPETGELPEGFDPLQGERVMGWFSLVEGNSIQGLIRDNYETKGKFGQRRVFKIVVTAGETEVQDANGEPVTAGEGDLVGLDERGWLKKLTDLPRNTEVFIKCLGKSAPTKEQPRGVWRFTLGVKK